MLRTPVGIIPVGVLGIVGIGGLWPAHTTAGLVVFLIRAQY